MIRFSLRCEAGHDFESWFPSGEAFDGLRARGLLSCPVCGSPKVEKALMAPSLGRKGNRAAAPAEATPPPAAEPEAAGPVTLLSEKEKAVRTMLQALRAHVTENADYVGRSFADEARRMHYGEIEHRSIYGEAEAREAKALIEEGIEVHPLPPAPDERN
ncbi:DUF1178 family protein [Enterovirga sp.]|uniref:DUF1178 family protein n=1 Tax=Enterovirga sp. TaxID=2026350 RepID=UPI002C870E39|nr:DUF1178 family protein [Enterovirga sp.]HMO29095.1 DUF1178 family protein [Enterovirga sp.]